MANITQSKKIMRLYMYQRLIEEVKDNEEKEWQRRLANTIQQKLWLSPPSSLNDPFERNFKLFSDPKMILGDKELLQFHLDFIKKENIGISPEQFCDTLKSPDFRKQLNPTTRAWTDSLFSGHGVACFTSDPSNIPMWAHYANNHRGYCVEYELDISAIGKIMKLSTRQEDDYLQAVHSGNEIITCHYDNRDLIFVFTKVRYSATPPIMYLNELYPMRENPYRSTQYLVHNGIGVKYQQWEYENEYRLIVNTNSIDDDLLDLNLIPFLRVTGIIMGSQITEHEKSIFHTLCEQYNSPLHQAKCSDTDYKIVIDLVNQYSAIACE